MQVMLIKHDMTSKKPKHKAVIRCFRKNSKSDY